MIDNDIEVVVVMIRYRNRIRWFQSDREFWILDYVKWENDFKSSGYEVPERDGTERFGIPIVNQATVDKFLEFMHEFEVTKEILREELLIYYPKAKSWWDVGGLFPIMFVDFDSEHVGAFYPNGIPMERYIPNGWTSRFEDFANEYSKDIFPNEEKFWINNGQDLLKKLNELGRDT